MHFILGNQDSRFFGRFYMSFFSKLFFFIRCLRLIGFPFSMGFYSKDYILGIIIYNGNFVIFCFCLCCCFTVMYRLRLLDLGFIGFSSFGVSLTFNEEKNFFIPVAFLFFLNVFLGN